MSTELANTTERAQKFFEDLEAQKTILSTCTQLFTSLTSHFASLQDSLSQKSESLDSKFLSLASTSFQTLDSISARESSIPDRESSVANRIESLKCAALEEFQNPAKGSGDLVESLKSLVRQMEAGELVRFIISRRKESVSLRAEIPNALAEAVDPPRLVLDAVEQFLSQKVAKAGGLTDKRWACGTLVQALFPESSWREKKGPEFARRIVERAAELVGKWKGQTEGETETVGAAEAVMFLQMVVGFGLREKFDEGFLRKLVVNFASRRDMAKLAAGLGMSEKIGDVIDELIRSGKEIEAVYFASEAGLTEKFSPVSLLKSHLRNGKKNAAKILRNGKYGTSATEESNNLELTSIKAIIKCVEDHKLEQEFPVDTLKKRAAQLEKARADRKKSFAASGKHQNKRSHDAGNSRGTGPAVFRPPKVAKYSSTYPAINRQNRAPAPLVQHSPAARYPPSYTYAAQSIYEAPTATPYASTYGLTHSQSPGAISQPHYLHPVDGISPAGYRTSSSTYGGQAGFGAYEYGSSAPSSYQPSYTQ